MKWCDCFGHVVRIELFDSQLFGFDIRFMQRWPRLQWNMPGAVDGGWTEKAYISSLVNVVGLRCRGDVCEELTVLTAQFGEMGTGFLFSAVLRSGERYEWLGDIRGPLMSPSHPHCVCFLILRGLHCIDSWLCAIWGGKHSIWYACNCPLKVIMRFVSWRHIWDANLSIRAVRVLCNSRCLSTRAAHLSWIQCRSISDKYEF